MEPYAIEPGQTVWVEVRVFSPAGGERLERVEARWQGNEGSNSYWEAIIGPFADAERVIYSVHSRSPSEEVSAPAAEFTVGPKIHLALLWHMHHPLYRDLSCTDPKGAYPVPWVRLHTLRDYYSMAALVSEFPDVHLTINLVPALLWQIEDYTEHGATDTKAEQVAGLPYLRVIINREAIARYGINASQILDTVAAMGGRVVGEVFEGQRRFFLQVRFAPEDRQDFEQIKEVRVADPSGRLIPLSQLADIRIEEGPAQISRENIHRRLAVEANVRGRDLARFVAGAQRAVENQVKLPPGYWIEWGGQLENLQRASARLVIVVPMALFLIFVLLYWTFNAATPALLIYLNVPLAATGGILALALRRMPFSISAGVGFIALFGVAVLNGVVLMSYVLQMRQEGLSGEEAARRGAEIRLRPVLMTALVASLGFVPMALSTSLQRR